MKGLPREVADAPSLEVLKTDLNGTLGNLIYCKVTLPMVGGWNYMIFKVVSNPNHAMIP